MSKKSRFPLSTRNNPKKQEYQGLKDVKNSLPTDDFVGADSVINSMMDDAPNSAQYKEPRIVRGKRYYISFYAINPDTNQLKRKKLELDLNSQQCRNDYKLRETKAEQYRREIHSLLKSGKKFKSNKPKGTLRPHLNNIVEALDYIHNVKAKKLQSNSPVHYYNHIRYFIKFLKDNSLDYLKPNQITRDLFKYYEDYLFEQTSIRTYQTIYNTQMTLLNYLNEMVAYGIIDNNPFRGLVKFDDAAQSVQQYCSFTKEQLNLLKDHFYQKGHDPYIWIFAMFIFHAFIRPNELRNLQVKHINFDNGTIIVPKYITVNNKTVKVAKKYPGEVFIFKGLQVYVDELNLQNEDLNKFIFTANERPGYKPFGHNTPYNRFFKGLKALGFKPNNERNGYSLYGMKHSGNEQYYEATKDIHFLRKQNRHKHTANTEKYIRHLNIKKYVEDVNVPI